MPFTEKGRIGKTAEHVKRITPIAEVFCITHVRGSIQGKRCRYKGFPSIDPYVIFLNIYLYLSRLYYLFKVKYIIRMERQGVVHERRKS